MTLLPATAARSGLALLGAALALGACRTSAPPAAPASPAASVYAATGPRGAPFHRDSVEAGVRAVLEAQVRAWNGGSVRGFMDGYSRADTLVFLSGSNARRGWDQALYAYLRSYPDAAAMGLLSFDEVTVEPLSADHALVWGRWALRVDGPLDGQPGGLFTLLFARTPEGWRIVHDHTS